MTSEFFYPHIGGIESVTEFLANEFTRLGHDVKIITNTTDIGNKEFTYQVLRKPSNKEFWKAYKWCDVFVHQGISLKRVWPLFLKRKPWFVVYHQVFYQKGFKGKLKKICKYFSHAIAVSETTRQGYQLKKADVILNTYDSSCYFRTNDSMRRDFVYLGKLTQTKGVHVLIKAFNRFKLMTGSDWTLTLIGGYDNSNSEKTGHLIAAYKDYLEALIKESPYSKDIISLGFKYPKETVQILNEKQIQIVPSLAPEAFGLVVLEGMACGCVIIGSDGDGIQEAMGNAGFTFKKGDSISLSEVMAEICNMTETEYINQKKLMQDNLRRLSLTSVARRYLMVFEKYC